MFSVDLPRSAYLSAGRRRASLSPLLHSTRELPACTPGLTVTRYLHIHINLFKLKSIGLRWPLFQGCWSSSDGCKDDCILESLTSYEEKTSSLKFCCCSGKFCNSEWREIEEESQGEKSSRAVDVIEKLQLSFFDAKNLSVLITVGSLSLTLVTLISLSLFFLYRRKLRKDVTLDKFHIDKVGLISNKI